ncbi:MAG: 2-hydroxyglutaryl-CoA dehydratase [Acidobacteriota bacterium]|nr:2-hydroxyglutaryl-CoA dehydratase [Acidobacteriota bacterium]
MILTAGIDVGSTYTKAVIVNESREILGQALENTGFQLAEVSRRVYRRALEHAGLAESDVAYIVATGFGRHMVDFRDTQVTDLTASASGAAFFFPGTRTVLDVGGQTMKASRIDDSARVKSFRLNDKCAAGTGAFLEKTARYMGYKTEEIGPLVATSKQQVAISGVCAVFAESEVINQLSLGSSPADIMHGAVASLVDRSVQLMKRVQMQPEYTLIGGILRFETMARVVREKLKADVNVPPEHMVQFVGALGAALLAQRRLKKLNGATGEVAGETENSVTH